MARSGSVTTMSRGRMWLIAGLLVVGIGLGVPLVGRALFASWSIGLFGRDTLTGSWIGTMRAKQGAEFGLFLELDYKSREGSYRRSHVSGKNANLEGRATICTPAGERYDYTVSGFASPFGTVETLYVE